MSSRRPVDDAAALSDVLTKLREELVAVKQQGEESEIKFLIEETEVELKFGVTRGTKAEGGAAFWVFNANAGAEASHAVTQTLRLKLKVVDKEGKQEPIADTDDRD